MLEPFTIARFLALVGEVFHVSFEAGEPTEVELISVLDLGSDRIDSPEDRRPFSIEFRAPMERVFPQRIYRIKHPELSSFELFLVPIGPDEVGMRYEAVFT